MKLLLNGGGSTKQLKLTMAKLNQIINHCKPILYVPLAMNEIEHSYDSCYEWFQKQIENVDVPDVDMPRTFLEFASKNFDDYSAIFIGGGNTYKLLKGIKDNSIFNKIIEYLKNNGIVVGCSAGAIIFGYDINSILVMDKNEVNLVDTKGFNILNGKSIFAHYTNSKTEEIHQRYTNFLINYSKEHEEVIAIPEEDTIYIDDEKIEFLGSRPYYEFREGVMTMNSIFQLVPYTDEYYNFVYEVKKNAYKKYVEECWGKWDEDAQRKYFDTFINQVEKDAWIIQLNGVDIGFYNGMNIDDETYEIGNICIIPEYQGKGIGTSVLKDIIKLHENQNILIQYFKQNPVGKLYERLGFIPNGETQFHYQMIKKKKI